MPTGIAKHRDDEIGSTIHDRRNRREAGRDIDKAAEANHANDSRQVADSGLSLGEHVDGGKARGLRSSLGIDIRADLTLVLGGKGAVALKRQLPRNDEQRTRLNKGNVVRNRRGGRGQGDAEFCKPGIDSAHGLIFLSSWRRERKASAESVAGQVAGVMTHHSR